MFEPAPYSITRWFDGTEVLWILVDEAGNTTGFDTREEAKTERNRLYIKDGIDTIEI